MPPLVPPPEEIEAGETATFGAKSRNEAQNSWTTMGLIRFILEIIAGESHDEVTDFQVRIHFPDMFDPNVAGRIMEELTQATQDMPELDLAADDTFIRYGQAAPNISVEIKKSGNNPIVPAELPEGQNIGPTGNWLPEGETIVGYQDGLLASVIGIIRAGIAVPHQDQEGGGHKRAMARHMKDVYGRVSRESIILPHYLKSSPLCMNVTQVFQIYHSSKSKHKGDGFVSAQVRNMDLMSIVFPIGNDNAYLPRLYNKNIIWTGNMDMKEVIGATDVLGSGDMRARLTSYRVVMKDFIRIPPELSWIVSPPIKGLARLAKKIRGRFRGGTPEVSPEEQDQVNSLMAMQEALCQEALKANQLDDEGVNLRRVTRVAGSNLRLFDQDSGVGNPPLLQGNPVTNSETGSTRMEWHVIRSHMQKGLERLWGDFKMQWADFVDASKEHYCTRSGQEHDFAWNICKDPESPVVWAVKWNPTTGTFYGNPGMFRQTKVTGNILEEGKTPENPGAIFVSPKADELLNKVRDMGLTPWWDFYNLPQPLIEQLRQLRQASIAEYEKCRRPSSCTISSYSISSWSGKCFISCASDTSSSCTSSTTSSVQSKSRVTECRGDAVLPASTGEEAQVEGDHRGCDDRASEDDLM